MKLAELERAGGHRASKVSCGALFYKCFPGADLGVNLGSVLETKVRKT